MRVTDNMRPGGTGEFILDGSAQQLPNRGAVAVILKAKSGNAANLWVGTTSGVTAASGGTDQTSGLELKPGEISPTILLEANLNELWVIGTNLEGLTYLIYDYVR